MQLNTIPSHKNIIITVSWTLGSLQSYKSTHLQWNIIFKLQSKQYNNHLHYVWIMHYITYEHECQNSEKKKNKEYSHALNEVWTKLQSIESMETNNIKIDIVNAQSSLLHNKCKGWSYAIQCIYKMITIHVRMRIHEHQPLKSHKLSNQFNFFQNFLLKCLQSNPATEYL